MSESTLEAPPVPESVPATPAGDVSPEPWTLRLFVRQHPWWTVAIGLVAVSGVFVLWAGTRPGYDPYGWLVWGYQTLHLTLDLGGAPSWKPLPYLFTVPFAVFGHYALYLWMVTCVAVSLAGAVFAGRIAYRLVGPGGRGRYPAIAAAVFAGLAVLGLEDYMHDILSAQSDPMIVTFCLAAIDCHLLGRYRWAFVLGVLAALGRPEAWPFLGLYAIWAWRRIPSMRWLLYGGAAVILFTWFGIPEITNHRPLVAGQLALKSPRELHQNKVVGTLGRFTELEYLPVWLAALAAVGWAVWRLNRLVLMLAGGAAAWVVVEVAFALHGWPALPRYLMEPAGVAVVLAGAAVGWTLKEAPRIRRGLPRWAGIPIVVVLVGSLVPGALARMRNERSDLHHERGRTHEIALLQTTLNVLGGYRHIRNCGEPVTNVEYVSAMAWFVKLDVGFVGHRPDFELHQKYPIVLFTPLVHGGWSVLPWHTRASQLARCSRLKAAYVITRRHPGGVLVRR
ncbi:MAG: hypothetical protein JO206_11415 [Solirubrobacterales bacterium]|nr:hypothetical protein [Solirubrobacterales bacterium]MBV9473568.1 hypothetical protein [Solirubrobacterales bacterium]